MRFKHVLFLVTSSKLSTSYNAPQVTYVGSCQVICLHSVLYNLMQLLGPNDTQVVWVSEQLNANGLEHTDWLHETLKQRLPATTTDSRYVYLTDHLYLQRLLEQRIVETRRGH